MAITLYGIRNCDTMRKARQWLDAHGVDYQFHDYRKDGLDEEQLRAWVDELGWEALLNKRGLTWRKLPPEVREAIDKESAIQIMRENPAIIKRPLLDLGDRRVVGFDEARYAELFS